MDPDAVDRVVRKYAAALGLDRGYSAHSMRATFITTALENGAQLEDVQKAAGHRDPVGLTPKKYQSGETDVAGRISKIGDGSVRTALYEAAALDGFKVEAALWQPENKPPSDTTMIVQVHG